MSFNFNIARRNAISSASSVTDADAQIYIDVIKTHISVSVAHQTIIDNLFISLKSNGLYSKSIAFYPIYGSVGDSQKYNAKNPLNTDTAYRLGFTSSVSHSFNSLSVPNLISEYAETYINQLNNTVLNDFSFCFYSKTESQINSADVGCGGLQLFSRRTGDLYLSDVYLTTGASRVTSTATTSIGSFGLSLLPSPVKHSIYQNGTLKNSRNDTTGTRSDSNILIGNRNGASTGTGRIYAFAFFGSGLTDSEMSVLNSIIQTYVTNINA
ncbi:hypothetical protein [Lacinutrix sp. Hel_I_90]|uniref:hypothetical protein n=1 Tax=Lacinutrix sp. Hel_I_90 TaxID=1249999 RepID=UPI0005C9623F|nr:hypothetical protein [Lacinutrix sp. Hel_I_90]